MTDLENGITKLGCVNHDCDVCKTTQRTSERKRQWVGLTPKERDEINEQVYGAVPHYVAFHAAIEAKLKEKNT